MNAHHENPYAVSARFAKLSKLIDAVDAHSRARGLDPRRDAAAILAYWREASGVEFAKLVDDAGVRPPSAVTLEQWFGALAHRADRGAS